MPRLTWGNPTERYYETGVDRGVLYVGVNPGVAWNGLTAVTESPTGGEAKPAYIDGYKFRNLASTEEFEATIEAFSAPLEFGPCDGTTSIQNGLFITQQPRKKFGFTYRTMVGDAVRGHETNYKIHIVYDALAAPSERSNNTLADSVDAAVRSWSVTTRAPQISSHRPTSHFVIDSRYTPKGLLAAIEDMLYGNASFPPRLPSVSELTELFQSEGPVKRRNLVLNPEGTSAAQWGASVPGATIVETLIAANGDGPVLPDGRVSAYVRYTTSGVRPPANSYVLTGTSVSQGWGTLPAGTPVLTSMYVRSSTAQNVAIRSWRYLDGAFAGTIQLGETVSIPANVWVRLVHMSILEAPTNSIRASVVLTSAGVLDQIVEATAAVVEDGVEDLGYFSGDTIDGNGYAYSWSSTPGLSVSELRTWR